MIWGKCYDNVRQALLKRGCSTTQCAQQLSDSSSFRWFENPVKNSRAWHFKWTLKLDDVEEGFDELREDQIVNHYRRSYGRSNTVSTAFVMLPPLYCASFSDPALALRVSLNTVLRVSLNIVLRDAL